MFAKADLVLLTKVDLMPYSHLLDAILDSLARAMPGAECDRPLTRGGLGVDDWLAGASATGAMAFERSWRDWCDVDLGANAAAVGALHTMAPILDAFAALARAAALERARRRRAEDGALRLRATSRHPRCS